MEREITPNGEKIRITRKSWLITLICRLTNKMLIRKMKQDGIIPAGSRVNIWSFFVSEIEIKEGDTNAKRNN